jgi:hypothetical protein
MATLIPMGFARAQGQKQAYQLALSKTKKNKLWIRTRVLLESQRSSGVLKAFQKQSRFCQKHKGVARSQPFLEKKLQFSIDGSAPIRNDRCATTCSSMPCPNSLSREILGCRPKEC